MDALGDILRSAHLSGGVYFRCEFSAPWGMQMPGTPMAEFHVIVRGQCWLRVPGEKNPIPLRGGDVAVFMTGGPHALLDSPKAKALPPEIVLNGQNLENFGPVTFGGGGAPATVLCGYFRFDPASRHPLIGALPSFIHVRDPDDASTASLQTVVTLMMQETRAARPGAEVVINRLCEVLRAAHAIAAVAPVLRGGTGVGAPDRQTRAESVVDLLEGRGAAELGRGALRNSPRDQSAR
jgi:hypothetical protein